MGETMIYGIAEEKGIWRVYYLLDPKKIDKEQNRRYVGSFDREDRAREYLETRKTLETLEDTKE